MNPKAGELWWVDLDPAVGDETQKSRVCLVIGEFLLHERLRTIVPMMKWNYYYEPFPQYFVRIQPDAGNHLDSERTPDIGQVKAASLLRFVNKKGELSASQMELVKDSLRLLLT
jgi:mRNA interferase MazF